MFESPSEASFCADLFPAAAYAPPRNGYAQTFNALTPFAAGPKGSGRLVFWPKFSVQIHTEGPRQKEVEILLNHPVFLKHPTP